MKKRFSGTVDMEASPGTKVPGYSSKESASGTEESDDKKAFSRETSFSASLACPFPAGTVLWATLFATAFGYTEAILVVYLRQILGEPHGVDYAHIFQGRGLALNTSTVFADAAFHGTLHAELSREVATLLLLLGAAMAIGRTTKERLAFFLWTFAVWDETYYLFLSLWTHFPARLTDIDIYFLVPWAWYGPVWFPVLIVMPLLMVCAVRLWSGKILK